jgi:hypothetical protein
MDHFLYDMGSGFLLLFSQIQFNDCIDLGVYSIIYRLYIICKFCVTWI